ncbi:helix-turn-helix transcriptional regulator [Clostridium botulinum]|uniref:helix-turn-helix domain-containing protein n=1 Tax=Clostridium botulinum TaxID=1491 RepID=UPI0006A6F803|nr:helix-turn-helix transcriptional regulator [Clostridium botulinum]KAI3349021.1 helix-turn-helix transcriptional regulator [Clostridium botulinum]KOM88006.1 Cro/Cl family transcriptional regulator [Clostridium botulinum]KOR61996.1 Cro/Cl family transcriptional regulator [Clostridium botulinum]MBY7023621.1 helix-turn-helix transcriptional regulator [Clostridium botulinum]NFR78576.1 helix-turn-helix transcriptional regulator [Clostridium botulinum]
MLKKKRVEKNLTELKFAKRIGISKSYVSKLENHPDKCNPTINLILKIAKELELNPFFVFKFFIKDRKN